MRDKSIERCVQIHFYHRIIQLYIIAHYITLVYIDLGQRISKIDITFETMSYCLHFCVLGCPSCGIMEGCQISAIESEEILLLETL